MNVSEATKKWINQKYIEWRNGQPKGRDTVTEFAEHVGVSRNTMNNWMNRGKTPDDDSVGKLAKLGVEIYDLLSLPRPDPLLQLVIQHWGLLSDDVRKEIAETVQRAEARGALRERGARVAPPKRRGKAGD